MTQHGDLFRVQRKAPHCTLPFPSLPCHPEHSACSLSLSLARRLSLNQTSSSTGRYICCLRGGFLPANHASCNASAPRGTRVISAVE